MLTIHIIVTLSRYYSDKISFLLVVLNSFIYGLVYLRGENPRDCIVYLGQRLIAPSVVRFEQRMTN